MPVLRITLAYSGTGFAGWAAQPGERTVEGELASALERVLGARVDLIVAGRTDAGVHAWHQVVSVELADAPRATLARSLNALTSPEIAVLSVEEVPEGFDARRDACSRTYCYRLLTSQVPDPFEQQRALWWPHRVDRDALGACADALRGTHNFTAFTPTDTYHVRFERDILRAEWKARAGGDTVDGGDSEMLEFWVEADAFMRHMVRVLVGTMLEVAGGRRSVEDFCVLLRGAQRYRAGETVPPHGLYLAAVSYDR